MLCKTFRWCWGAVLKFLEVVGGVCGGCGWCCVKFCGGRWCCVKFSGGERMLCKNFLELGGALQKFMGALRCCGKFSGCVCVVLWKM